VPRSGSGIADFRLTEQGFHRLRLVLPPTKVRTGLRSQVTRPGRIRLRHMAFDIAVEQLHGVQLGARVVPPADGPANASPDDPHDQLLDASLLPSQLLTVEVLRRPIEFTLGIPITQHNQEPTEALLEAQHQVSGLLCNPLPRRMRHPSVWFFADCRASGQPPLIGGVLPPGEVHIRCRLPDRNQESDDCQQRVQHAPWSEVGDLGKAAKQQAAALVGANSAARLGPYGAGAA
jgi:hypothetical protein